MAQGFLSIILHAHLPYVRHPEYKYSLEEKWFFEALTECYIPILMCLEKMRDDRIECRLTFSLSPTLLAMMEDPLLRERYGHYLDRLQNLARLEEERTTGDENFAPLARMYRRHFDAAAAYFYRYGGRLAGAFRRMAEENYLEIITCASTHSFLPLLAVQPESVYAQAANAMRYHAELFGEAPRGIWIPECAYYQGLEEILGELGAQYFITATHGVLYATPRPKYAVYSPILTPAGVAVFGRDSETSKQVWSAKEGYPGDYSYREFYRDIAYDLPLETIGAYLHPPGLRTDSGIKYYRITGKGLEYKEPYRPKEAMEKAARHAGNFMFNREQQVRYLSSIMGRPPIIVSPYDAELFGHWWFEGPLWLDYLCRKMAYDQSTVKMITPGDYLDLGYPLQTATPNPSSWGDKGHNEVWLNRTNDWTYRHLHRAAEEMVILATEHPEADDLLRRALNQAARELLLAQSSDWPFIMNSGTMVEYALKRLQGHLVHFRTLSRMIQEKNIDGAWLKELEAYDNLFPRLDYRLYQSLESAAAQRTAVV
ncbi:MAG: DUF1957 domain-containing protein [Dethiobacter sp.]|nr:DUF1957 domain-containing protein [Dethiobacter sp.]